ncbi:MAG TPA: RnfABCDGE type electron transport complex subunit G [Candidatus Wallbacteria bacterium]|nr:RnfABCDGE type electron transport complex subunit G [Candidatus Wallbacteria bacterium]
MMNRIRKGNSDLNLLIVLTLFSAISGLILALVNNVTKDRIAMVAVIKQKKALMEVMPAFDTAEAETILADPMDPFELFVCKKDQKPVGIAVMASSRLLSAEQLKKLAIPENIRQDQSYADPIKLLVGFTIDGKIKGVSILDCKETPGLGTNINTPAFKSNYVDAGIDLKKWSVKKDGGDVEQLTAATISSRATTAIVAKSIAIYKNKVKSLNLK